MKAQLLALLIVASMFALAASVPTVFMGGDFLGLAGTGAWEGTGTTQFAAFNRGTSQWSTAIHQPNFADLDVVINDIDDARTGVFAAGSFQTITAAGVKTEGVAYWDGTKWCSIREAVDGVGAAVVCDSESSCWVAGAFSSIHNIPVGTVDNAVDNFVHYTFDEAGNEWVVDRTALSWNRAANTTNLLPDSTDPARLYIVGSGAAPVFFASSGNTIYRGSAANVGWHVWATPDSVSTGAAAADINDWTVEGSTVYVLLNLNPQQVGVDVRGSGLITGAFVTGSCAPTCNPTVPADWEDLVAPSVNGSIYTQITRIAVTGTTRYLLAEVDPDTSGASDAQSRWRVLSHTGGAALTNVGEPFLTSTSNPVVRLFIDDANNVVAVGPEAGNLFFPPATDDDSGATVDIRSADRFNHIAVFDGTRWVQAFGGGFEASNPNNATTQLREAFNSRTSEWFFIGGFKGTYDVHADSLGYFDNDAELATPYFALFSRALHRRDGDPAAVYDVVCAEADCANLFVGGSFHFHGPDTYGAIASVAVDNTGSPTISPVGGGLWNIDVQGSVRDNPPLQVSAGRVYALARNNNYLYAAGAFSRGSSPESPDYVCLNNVARLDIDTPDAAWEDLHAGCDNEVHDLVFWSGLLIAGGEFVQCGGGRVVNYVASYSYQSGDNAQWASLNNGVDGPVNSLEVFQGRLIAGGGFGHAGGLPVTGVASWDGWKWRALVPACTDDCVSGLDFYYTNLVSPSAVYDLRTGLGGDFLWARVSTGSLQVLAKWQYVDGDLGRWTATGDAVTLSGNAENRGHRVANLGSDNVILAAGVDSAQYQAYYGDVGVYHSGIDNWVVDSRTAVSSDVFVIRGPQASSASALSSPLSALLSLF